MAEKKTKPALRFQGFTDDWEERKLGDIVEELYNGQTPYRQNKSYWNGNINWLSSGDLNRGIVTSTMERITEEGRNASRLRVIPKGTFVIAVMGLEAAGTRGNCGILGIDTTINQACMAIIVDGKRLSSRYLSQWYRCFGNSYALKYCQGTKQQNYNAELLGDLDIKYPTIDEQVMISQYFDNFDNLITNHQCKLDRLLSVKRSMLEKLFPRNGSAYPELRFDGFTDPWKYRVLGELFEEYSEKNHPELPALTIIQGGGTIRRDESDRFLQYDKASLSNYKMVNEGDFIVHLRSFEGGLEMATTRGVISPAYHTFHGENTDSMFYYSYFRSERFIYQDLKPHVYGIRDGRSIDIDGMKSIRIPWTSYEEQYKIGRYIKQIDTLITLHKDKLDKLKYLKQSMLQKMFV